MSGMIDEWLHFMVEHAASDLFVTAGAPPSLKVNGRIEPIGSLTLSDAQTRDIVLGLMSPAQMEEFEHTHECQFALSRREVGRFRVSAFFQRGSVGAVLRRIETRIPTIEELQMPATISSLAMLKRGLVIVVGATGAGKSTTLAAMLGYRNMHSTGHIITIEDPIEFVHRHQGCLVSQRELGIDTDSWGAALKNTLRQAPDVILIGEVRTREGMEYAINFAETGHLCLCTLHANNANQAIERIISFFPPEQHAHLLLDLSLNLKGVVAQQLVVRPDGQSRQAILEVMLGSPLIQDLIRTGDVVKIKDVMRNSTESGMCTFDQSLVQAYHQGQISYEDALRYADSTNEVRLQIKLARPGSAEALLGETSRISLEQIDDGASPFDIRQR
ncbi:PilT/PilU family type 4a pilus ATPase [Frateuria aurantia]